jgi:hypothetical protein
MALPQMEDADCSLEGSPNVEKQRFLVVQQPLSVHSMCATIHLANSMAYHIIYPWFFCFAVRPLLSHHSCSLSCTLLYSSHPERFQAIVFCFLVV